MITDAFQVDIPTHTSPRSIVKVGGFEVPFISWTTESSGFDSADSFEVVLPFSVTRDDGDILLVNSANSASAVITEPDILVEIYRGNPLDPEHYTTNDLTRTMYGFMDHASIIFNEEDGEQLKITGRNLAALFIDNKVLDKYPNKTSSQIATLFANQNGLTPAVTSTSTFAGTYYNNDSTILSQETSQWDLLLFLAKQEGFVLRVKDTTLYFGPPDQVTDVNLNPIPMTWGNNILEMEIERAPHAARDITVEVLSYDRDHKKQIVAKAQSTTQRASKLKNQLGREQYLERYSFPNLTRDQAQQRAKSILDTMSREQYIGTLKTTGDYGFSVDRRITLFGVGQILSQNYYINRVTETFDLNNGYESEIAFINQFLLPGGTL